MDTEKQTELFKVPGQKDAQASNILHDFEEVSLLTFKRKMSKQLCLWGAGKYGSVTRSSFFMAGDFKLLPLLRSGSLTFSSSQLKDLFIATVKIHSHNTRPSVSNS